MASYEGAMAHPAAPPHHRAPPRFHQASTYGFAFVYKEKEKKIHLRRKIRKNRHIP
jgi:hypothetical protein